MVKIKLDENQYEISRDLDLNEIKYSDLDMYYIKVSIPTKQGNIINKYYTMSFLNSIDHAKEYIERVINIAFKKYDKKMAIKGLVQRNADLEKRVDALECHINALFC